MDKNMKDALMVGGIMSVSTVIVTGVLYLVKTKKKSKKKLKESMAILEESLENKNWWLTKECQTRSRLIIDWVSEKRKESRTEDKKLEEALETIKQEHWMTKKYQCAFRVVYDWAKIRL